MNKQTYDPGAIEPKWQKRWEEAGFYQAVDPPKAGPKKYLLIEFPYPSGERLHVGHGRSYTCVDMMARMYRMKGFNVLYPLGWDAFGLPAENYALKTGINPAITTQKNIKNAKAQAKRWGLSFDWSREINTTNPAYYQWTQWIFLKLLERGLAYQDEVSVNWCPFCKTNLADEEVLADGTHERCGNKTERRLQKQWLLRITKYADRLLEDLNLVDYLPRIAQQQINWIGRKEWIDISYPIEGVSESIIVSTTRPDTNFGATFIVVAPEHDLIKKILSGKLQIPNSKLQEISKYVEISKTKSELDRISEKGKKTGVFTGLYAVNQLNNYKMPIWISDFVLLSVGTGVVIGVPGHDLRDFEFAKEFKLPIIRVVVGKDRDKSIITKKDQVQEEEGTMINSDFLNGMDIKKAMKSMVDYLEEKGWGKRVVRYHLRDWVFSRQHYWGEPIPVVHCEKCGIVPVPYDQLPVKLPALEKYQPTGTGESPLAQIKDWVNTKCPVCGGPARRETDTMPNWAGSNWYYLAYLIAKKLQNSVILGSPKDDSRIKKTDSGQARMTNFARMTTPNDIFSANEDLLAYWLPVDLYNGGMEHTTLHLLYSRFIYKFLFDLGVVPGPEPYAKRRSHGVVLGPDGQKMSKSRGNVVNPDEVISAYGADTFRLYEAFMGPFDQQIAWSEEGVEGCFRFLKRVYSLAISKIKMSGTTGERLLRKLQQTIKKVGEDLEQMKFNTGVAAMMEFINAWQDDEKGLTTEDLKKFLLILAPFAPHIAEELWHSSDSGGIGDRWSIYQQLWPEYDSQLLADENTIIIVEINGKVREKIEVGSEKLEDGRLKWEAGSEMEKLARKSERTAKYLAGKKIKQVIFVPGKLINFVVK